MKYLTKTLILFCCILMSTSCSKHPILPDTTTLTLQLAYGVDGEELVFDTKKYINEAGNEYTVTRFQYYVSGIILHKSDGSKQAFDEVHYIDAKKPETNFIRLQNMFPGEYTAMQFNIGLDSTLNKSGALETTQENLNMHWPDQMGGGYHFIKFEGHFMDTLQQISGYAIHLGRNINLVRIHIENPFTISHHQNNLKLTMNLNEWFRNPNLYDLNYEKPYTMTDMQAMKTISENGGTVFGY